MSPGSSLPHLLLTTSYETKSHRSCFDINPKAYQKLRYHLLKFSQSKHCHPSPFHFLMLYLGLKWLIDQSTGFYNDNTIINTIT